MIALQLTVRRSSDIDHCVMFLHESNMDDIDMKIIDEELYEFNEDSLDGDDLDKVTAEVPRPSTFWRLVSTFGSSSTPRGKVELYLQVDFIACIVF